MTGELRDLQLERLEKVDRTRPSCRRSESRFARLSLLLGGDVVTASASALPPAASGLYSSALLPACVNAAVAAGLPRPPQSVYPHVRDLDGLASSCRRGRAVGHLGRAAIHPTQLEVIECAYLPTAEEAEAARATVATVEGAGAGTLGDGAFVDPAMIAAARQVLSLVDAYGVSAWPDVTQSR